MEQTTNYLGKCKDCAYAIFATGADVQDADGWREVKAGAGVFRVGNNGCFARCDKGHKFFACKVVKGTYSKDHKCDSRCLNAKGHECTCSCGGANHGRGHVATVTQAADLPTAPVTAADFEVQPRRTLGPLVSGATLAPIAPAPAGSHLRHLGVIGKNITGEVTVDDLSTVNGSTLYTFKAVNGGHIVKWFAPNYADPQWPLGKTFTLHALVKRHDTFRNKPETVVTYATEVESNDV